MFLVKLYTQKQKPLFMAYFADAKAMFFLLLLHIKNIPRLLQGFQSLEFYNLQ